MQYPLNHHQMHRLPISVVDREDDRCCCVPKRSKKNRSGNNNDDKIMNNKAKNYNEDNENTAKVLSSSSSSSSSSITDNYGPNDVLCGRGRISLSHEGNKRFCNAIEQYLDPYINASTKRERSKIVHSILDIIKNSGGTFKKKAGYPPTYTKLSQYQCREKVGHALRDTAKSIYKKRGLVLPSTFFPDDTHKNINSNSNISSSSICDNVSNLHDESFSSKATPTVSTTTASATTKALTNTPTNGPLVTNDNYFMNDDDDEMNHTEILAYTELLLSSSENDGSMTMLLEDDEIVLLSEEPYLCSGILSASAVSDFAHITQTIIPTIDENSIVMTTATLITDQTTQLITAEANAVIININDDIDTISYDQSQNTILHHGSFMNNRNYDDADNYNYPSNSNNNTRTVIRNGNIINIHYGSVKNNSISHLPIMEPKHKTKAIENITSNTLWSQLLLQPVMYMITSITIIMLMKIRSLIVHTIMMNGRGI